MISLTAIQVCRVKDSRPSNHHYYRSFPEARSIYNRNRNLSEFAKLSYRDAEYFERGKFDPESVIITELFLFGTLGRRTI